MAYKENYPSKLLEEAVDAISTLPGVGRRSALRLALHLLKQPAENVHHFTAAIDNLRDEVKYCQTCRMISDNDICSICSDKSRDHRTICVVESVRDVMSIENTGQFHGVYHVLGGIISPINGIGPSDIEVDSLVSRVAEGNVQEVILALSPTMEGDTTNFYIYRKLAPTGVKVSVIARGVAVGNELEYTDEVTLGRSIMNRTLFEDK
jgi:recombination protein RecR